MNMKKHLALACMALALFMAGTSMAVDNTGTGGVIMYTDSNGSNAVANPPYIGGYVVHTFTNSGTLNIPIPASANVLVVAGGGGGGSFAGGGGAGGLIYSNAFPVAANSNYTVTVGVGGAGGVNGGTYRGGAGSNSLFGALIASGGGGGGARDGGVGLVDGLPGGSGGGGSPRDGAPQGMGGTNSPTGQGYPGGNGPTWGWGGGGGGGAGFAGTNASVNNAGAGGNGLAYSLRVGTNEYFGGGGGGGGYSGGGAAAAGGLGGGGNGSVTTSGANGAPNTGGGGGGGAYTLNGGSGGSGIVIVRYMYSSSLSLSVTAPANGQSFLPDSSVTATVSVAHGTAPYSVEFYTNGVSAWSTNSSLTNLFTIDLGALADGTYTNYATVTDSATPTAATAFSATNTFTVGPDTTAPMPNPMTFALAPPVITATSVVMTASTATDVDVLSPPVYYFFTNTVNGATSGWISSTVWTNTGLTLGTTYGYQVKARDSAVPPNETGWSATLTAPAFGGEYFVATNGSDTVNNGMSLDSPFRTISNAVARSDATIVTVANGTYNIGDQITVGKALTIRSFGGSVYGGLANATNTVVNRGGGASRVFNLSVAGVVLDGLTITGSGGSGYSGGGVYMPSGGTVQNCIVRNNKGPSWDGQFGGGVYMVGGTLSNCIVQANTTANNRGGAGAGIYADNSQIINCQVIGNTNDGFVNAGPADGGGIYATASTLIRNCLIASNKAVRTSGGGVYGGRIENCTIVGNSASWSAGGVYGSVVTNSIVLDNTTGVEDFTTKNYGGPSTFAYSYSLPKPAGVGNINSASFVDAAGGNYRLMPCPAVDGGTNLTWMAGALDLDGNPRTNGVNNRVDMGAYERVPGALQCGLAADVLNVLAPSNVVFTAFLDGTNKNITSYNWNFGDSQTASGATLSSVTNTYSAAGSYTVTLTVANDAGESASATNSNYVAVWSTAYVWTNSPSPSVPYHTWSNAARTIADAVVAAPAGSTVIVTNGTYNISLEIPVSKALTIRSFGNGVYGGLANASNTVVSGPQNQGYGGPRIFNLTAAGTVLDGFTITKGYGALAGLGVYMTDSTVINCIIKNNGKPEYYFCVNAQGAGVYMVGGTLSNCVVQGNTSGPRGGAGGIYANGGLIVDCQVLNNTNSAGWTGGGGIFANNAQIVNCQVIGNTSSSDLPHGGGIYAQGSTLVRNCLIVSNAVGNQGGGVFGGRIENCTIVKNSCSSGTGAGGGVYGSVVTNSIVWNNTTGSGTGTNYGGTCTFGYSCTAPLPAGTDNIMSDPLFVNPAAGDYRLASKPPASPCNDKGMNLVWMTGAVDLGGNLRIQHDIVDMGAYESVFIPAGTVITFR